MAIPRSRYREVGGHESVRGDVAEDLALAQVVHAAGLPVEAWAGGGVEYRMYPEGLAALVEGWTKNLAAGASVTARLRVLLVALWITGVLSVVPVLLGGGVGLVIGAAVAVQAAVLLRRVGSFDVIDALAVPLLVAVFVGLFAMSAWRRVRRRPVAWRGRVVPQRSA
jgi:4,4'-diaponeurosporenoate glycosyltransferase